MGAEKDKNPATGLRECHYGTLQNYRLKRSRKTVPLRAQQKLDLAIACCVYQSFFTRNDRDVLESTNPNRCKRPPIVIDGYN